MDIYNFMNQKYEEYQKTGKSSIKFPKLYVKQKQLNETKFIQYSCSHDMRELVINTTSDTLAIYSEWKESKSNLCIKCWLKNKQRI